MYSINIKQAIFLSIITLFLIANDYIRAKFLSKHYLFWYYASFIISNVFAGFLLYEVYSIGSQIYIIFLLIEIIVTTQGIPSILVGIHLIIFLVSLKSANTNIKDILTPYLVTMCIIFLFRNILLEKVKIETLNHELNSANSTLKQYSKKIQELTISKERTRIAQELHDSLGHYLIALTMNLEFAGKVVDTEPKKAKNVINKSQDLTKDCILNLRKAVALLNDNVSQKELFKSINEIFRSFPETDEIEFVLDMDEEVGFSNPDIKNCIYKTVQEAITNGIKHGNATYFSINIHKNDEQISIIIMNNGSKCSDIIKSNGLKGIENRIIALGGEVHFYSDDNNSGFIVKANIPEILDL
jgi:signal transduction histidine kinase